jgi:hypothetical protein
MSLFGKTNIISSHLGGRPRWQDWWLSATFNASSPLERTPYQRFALQCNHSWVWMSSHHPWICCLYWTASKPTAALIQSGRCLNCWCCRGEQTWIPSFPIVPPYHWLVNIASTNELRSRGMEWSCGIRSCFRMKCCQGNSPPRLKGLCLWRCSWWFCSNRHPSSCSHWGRSCNVFLSN